MLVLPCNTLSCTCTKQCHWNRVIASLSVILTVCIFTALQVIFKTKCFAGKRFLYQAWKCFLDLGYNILFITNLKSRSSCYLLSGAFNRMCLWMETQLLRSHPQDFEEMQLVELWLGLFCQNTITKPRMNSYAQILNQHRWEAESATDEIIITPSEKSPYQPYCTVFINTLMKTVRYSWELYKKIVSGSWVEFTLSLVHGALRSLKEKGIIIKVFQRRKQDS